MAQNWFKHDYNARNDDDILELRAEYGWKGYGLFYAFIETMAENEKGAIDMAKIGGLSVGFNLPKGELITFVETCLDIGLFTKDEDGFIRNNRITKHVKKMNTFKEAGKKGAKKRWSKDSDEGANRGANATPNADKRREDKNREDNKERIYLRDLSIEDFPEDEKVKRFTVYCWQKIKQNYPDHDTVHEATFETWYDPLRKLIEYRGFKLAYARKLWDWATDHQFWKPNIRSTTKFYKQRESLDAQFKNDHSNGQKTNTNGSKSRTDKFIDRGEELLGEFPE